MVFAFYIILLLTSSVEPFDVTGTNKNRIVQNDQRKIALLGTPSPNNPKYMVPKDINEFQKQPKDKYHIHPTNQQALENMLAYADNVVPKNYDADVVNITSEQFEIIKARQEKKALEESRTDANLLRQDVKIKRLRNAMDRAAALMTQFVYGARYKLQYGQSLRAVYSSNIEYKIGYLFALIRDINQQQLHLYSTMDYNFLDFQKRSQLSPSHYSPIYFNLDSYLQIYEKIVRLHIDMKDVIALVKKLELQRVAEANKVDEVTTTTDDSTDVTSTTIDDSGTVDSNDDAESD